jgi:hypothetical protein
MNIPATQCLQIANRLLAAKADKIRFDIGPAEAVLFQSDESPQRIASSRTLFHRQIPNAIALLMSLRALDAPCAAGMQHTD